MQQNRLLALLITSAVTCAPIATAHAQCACDFNNDGVRDSADLAYINAAWGTPDGDCTGDGFTDGADSSRLLSGWGACPTPTWATVLEWKVNDTIVTDPTPHSAIYAIDLPWRVRDNGTGIEMLLIPQGFFTMGCTPSLQSPCDSDENPTRTVTLTNAFYLGRYEVTQLQWFSKMGYNLSECHGTSSLDAETHPVETVSWNEIAVFNAATGLRLPTEAEWEYAYRAQMGTKVTRTAFHNGTDDDARLGEIAWFTDPLSEYCTKNVGGKAANELGLHDMSGNVWEWVNDWYGSYSSAGSTNPIGPSSGTDRVMRGGSWVGYSYDCRASRRKSIAPGGISGGIVGFRSARNP